MFFFKSSEKQCFSKEPKEQPVEEPEPEPEPVQEEEEEAVQEEVLNLFCFARPSLKLKLNARLPSFSGIRCSSE